MSFTVNLDLALILFPQKYNAQIPMIPSVLVPANTVTPLPIPKFIYSSFANIMLPHAKARREKPLAANRLAAYCRYDVGMYTKIRIGVGFRDATVRFLFAIFEELVPRYIADSLADSSLRDEIRHGSIWNVLR
jgi:hypothetical protein